MEETGSIGLTTSFVQEITGRVQSLLRFSETHDIPLDPNLSVQTRLLNAHVLTKSHIPQVRLSEIESKRDLTLSGEILISEGDDVSETSNASSVNHKGAKDTTATDTALGRLAKERRRKSDLQHSDRVPETLLRPYQTSIDPKSPLFSPVRPHSRDHLSQELLETKRQVHALHRHIQRHVYLRSQEDSLQAELTGKIQSLTEVVSQLNATQRQVGSRQNWLCRCCGWRRKR